MSKFLTTFSGKFGDILWSLATVKQIGQLVGEKVDFCCRAEYESLIPLIQMQPYIDKAFVDHKWLLWHSNHGDQPWQPQDHVELEKPYEKVWHLTYKGHPGINSNTMALIDFVAYQQGIKLQEPVCPFILLDAPYEEKVCIRMDQLEHVSVRHDEYIAYAFNDQYEPEKATFKALLFEKLGDAVPVVDVGQLEWRIAAQVIKCAVCFVGCKSANYVLAHGVAQKNIFIYEPHPGRHPNGHLGGIFGNPHWPERSAPLLMPVHMQAEVAAAFIRTWRGRSSGGVYQNVAR